MRNGDLVKRVNAGVEKKKYERKSVPPGHYYVRETTIRGEEIKHDFVYFMEDGVEKRKAISQAEGVAMCDEHKVVDSCYELIRRNSGEVMYRREADYSDYVNVAATVKSVVENTESVQVTKTKRPDRYVVHVTNLPPEIRGIKGRKSSRKIEVEEQDNELKKLKKGETPCDTWAQQYHLCIDIKRELAKLGWRTMGNYKQGIWRHSKPGSPDCVVSMVTHLEKIMR